MDVQPAAPAVTGLCTRCNKPKTCAQKMCEPCRKKKYAEAAARRAAVPGGTVRESDGFVKCTHCPRWCPPEAYVGPGGTTTRRCQKCRDVDNRAHAGPEVKAAWAAAKARENEAKSPPLTEKERTKRKWDALKADEVEYAKYKERMAAHGKTARGRLTKYKSRARANQRAFELSDAAALEMMQSPCAYCGEEAAPDVSNGIDRMDPAKDFTVANCVSCCAACKDIKGISYDARAFVARCRRVSEQHDDGPGCSDPVDAAFVARCRAVAEHCKIV